MQVGQDKDGCGRALRGSMPVKDRYTVFLIETTVPAVGFAVTGTRNLRGGENPSEGKLVRLHEINYSHLLEPECSLPYSQNPIPFFVLRIECIPFSSFKNHFNIIRPRFTQVVYLMMDTR